MQHIKTYQFKLKPTKVQAKDFEQWLGSCRYVYNLCLDYKKSVYDQYKIKLSKHEIQKELAVIAKETDWIGCVYSQTLQDVIDRLFRSYDNFFKGAGFPRFAKKGFYHSFTFKQGVKVLPNTHKIQLPKIGKVSFRKSGETEGTIKTATVIKKADGWYVSLSCEVDINPLPETNQRIGIDVGITTLASLSNGKKIENPKVLQKHEHRLKKLQRLSFKEEKRKQQQAESCRQTGTLPLKNQQYEKRLSARSDHKACQRKPIYSCGRFAD